MLCLIKNSIIKILFNMKTRNFLLSLSFLFIIYIVPAKAIGNEEHAYQPFVENSKQWLVVCATSQIYWMKRYYITEDTTVNNRTCKKLYCQTIYYTEGTDITELYSIIYEDPPPNCCSLPRVYPVYPVQPKPFPLVGSYSSSVHSPLF